jgi:hypothetical protein
MTRIATATGLLLNPNGGRAHSEAEPETEPSELDFPARDYSCAVCGSGTVTEYGPNFAALCHDCALDHGWCEDCETLGTDLTVAADDGAPRCPRCHAVYLLETDPIAALDYWLSDPLDGYKRDCEIRHRTSTAAVELYDRGLTNCRTPYAYGCGSTIVSAIRDALNHYHTKQDREAAG